MLRKLNWQVRPVRFSRTSPEPVLPVSGVPRDSPRSQRGGRRSQDLPERDRTQWVAYGPSSGSVSHPKPPRRGVAG